MALLADELGSRPDEVTPQRTRGVPASLSLCIVTVQTDPGGQIADLHSAVRRHAGEHREGLPGVRRLHRFSLSSSVHHVDNHPHRRRGEGQHENRQSDHRGDLGGRVPLARDRLRRGQPRCRACGRRSCARTDAAARLEIRGLPRLGIRWLGGGRFGSHEGRIPRRVTSIRLRVRDSLTM
jgi:hypothetical protein